MSFRRIG